MSFSVKDVIALSRAMAEEPDDVRVYLIFNQTQFDQIGDALKRIGKVTAPPGKPKAYVVEFESESAMWAGIHKLEQEQING